MPFPHGTSRLRTSLRRIHKQPARSTRDRLGIADALRDRNADLVSIHEQIDTTTPQGRFVLSIFAALSELEREVTGQQRGKHIGRPPAHTPGNWDDVMARRHRRDISATVAAREQFTWASGFASQRNPFSLANRPVIGFGSVFVFDTISVKHYHCT